MKNVISIIVAMAFSVAFSPAIADSSATQMKKINTSDPKTTSKAIKKTAKKEKVAKKDKAVKTVKKEKVVKKEKMAKTAKKDKAAKKENLAKSTKEDSKKTQNKAKATSKPFNINSATAVTIAQNLKGVGPTRAAAIVKYREKNGRFASLEELSQVKGVGEKTLRNNKRLIKFK